MSFQVGTVSELPPGERKSTKVGDEDVLVVNHKNTIYALSPKCPHLGLPMKTGEISDDGPCITCKFHGTESHLLSASLNLILTRFVQEASSTLRLGRPSSGLSPSSDFRELSSSATSSAR